MRVESSIGSGSAVTKRKVPYIEFVKSGVVPYSFNREMTTSFPHVAIIEVPISGLGLMPKESQSLRILS